jgi:hypothetical protein
MKVINWGLMSHPMNWFTIVLMVLIAGIGFKLLAQHIKLSQQ